MAKRCWLVAFNQEMADPGKSVRHHRPQQRIPRMANHKSHNQRSQSEQRANRMHGTVASVAVLMQIEGKEVFVAGEFLWRHLFVLILRWRGWQEFNANLAALNQHFQFIVAPHAFSLFRTDIYSSTVKAAFERNIQFGVARTS